MEFKLKAPNLKKPGYRAFQIKFELETVSEEFRDNVLGMILAALDGACVHKEVEEKTPALGFHKEDDNEE